MLRNIINSGTKYYPQISRIVEYATRPTRKSQDFYSRDERDALFSNLMLNVKRDSVQEWNTLREDILSTNNNVTIQSIDSLILGFLISHQRYQQAKCYLDYTEQQHIKLNLAALGKCFKLHHALYVAKLSTEEDERNILSTYESLCKEYPILDSITSESVIPALAATKHWKECFKLLDNIKISCVPNGLAYNAIISAAFSHNEYDKAWELFQEMLENNRHPFTLTYLTYLDQIQREDDEIKYKKLDELLEFTACYDLKVDERVADKIYKITNHNAKVTSIANNGACKRCSKKLQLLELSTSEFDRLKTAFFEDVVVGRDVFCNSTPEELERFKDFVQHMGKIDVIVDGLNVVYAAGAKQSPMVSSMLLASVVRHFVKLRKKVLVLGRNHLKRLPKQNWDFVKRNAKIFLTENLSQDDPYLLYCGLHSGLNTIIVSKDFMRSHLYLLKDKGIKLLFNRWLTQSRYHLIHAGPNNVVFRTPLPYMISAQKEGNQWHIPYILSTDNPLNPSTYKWLCVTT